MGRGTRKDKNNSSKPDNQLDSREVIFKSGGKGQAAIKQAEVDEAEKFARARKEKEGEKNAPTEIDEDGNRYWRNSAGELHRDNDLPALEYANGTRQWYQNGKRHRDGDLPAVEYANGTRSWHQNGQPHRDGDKPAWEDADGTRVWYQNGKRHRDGDEPAVKYAHGTQEWYQHGKRHRDGDLPAVEKANGIRQWWQNGVCFKEEQA